ncbi:MAG: bifunctional folylpolyglutamate synthase/dihydrofolate synthase [Clostridiales bacterium]|nr:bifunctional folylpolyglutamate synthase/dihydrofolate synthase [Clostridiales bacterium]
MNYDETIYYLEKCHRFGSKQGHENFKRLMSLLGEPQKNLKIIHVAGTNGKGSTCAMIYSILLSQGYNTGLFSSPHLERYNERIALNGEYISDYDFTRHIEIVKNKVFELFGETDEFFSFFEIITAAAFNYFNEKNADFVVLEVGLGGRLDSTNIIENPLVCVITSISFDHMEYLGSDIFDITREKGGIIKKNSSVVLYSQQEKVYNIIKEICSEKNSDLFYTDDYGINIINRSLNGTLFNVKNNYFFYKKIFVGLCGDYQIFNACNALMAVEALKKRGIFVSDEAVFDGLKNACIKGRMHIIMKNPLFILDGAHNIGGVESLNIFLQRLKSCNKKITIIIGILKDKNYGEMIDKITRFCDNVIFTEANSKRAIKSQILFKSGVFANKRIFIEENYKDAVELALKISDDNDSIICTGSLYLVGDVLKYFNNTHY